MDMMHLEEWLIGGGAAGLLIAVMWAIGNSIFRRLGTLEASDNSQASTIAELRAQHSEIKADVRGHIEREENILWPKVDDLTARLVRIEASLPNGELKTLLYRFNSLENKLDTTMGDLKAMVSHVSEEQRRHNAESEDWKRRIVRLEDRQEQQQHPHHP
jgi:regulator of replication initiation timing